MIHRRIIIPAATWIALALLLTGYDCCDSAFPAPLLQDASEDPVFKLDPRGFTAAYKAHGEVYALFEGRTLPMNTSHVFCKEFVDLVAGEDNVTLRGCRVTFGADLDGSRCRCEGTHSSSYGLRQYKHALVELVVERSAVFSSEEQRALFHVTALSNEGELLGPDCYGEDSVELTVESLGGDDIGVDAQAATLTFDRAFQRGVEYWVADFLELGEDIDRRTAAVLDPLIGCPEGTHASQSCVFPSNRPLIENAYSLCCKKGEALHGPWWEYEGNTVQLTREGVQGKRRVQGEFGDGQRTGTWTLSDANGNEYATATLTPIASNRPRKTLPKPDKNFVGMVHVPAGHFYTGCNEAKALGCEDQRPQSRVHLDRFYLDKLEVTEADYRACVDAGACSTVDGLSRLSDEPVTGVTPAEAQQYCRYKHKRLPTELEWDKAARGGCEFYDDCQTETRLFPWGDAPPAPERLALYDPDTEEGLRPVGSLTAGASPYGALDMMGNAGEWTVKAGSSYEHGVYVKACAAGDCAAEAFRQTHAYDDTYYPTLFRNLSWTRTPTSRSTDTGFRCVYSPPPDSTPAPSRGGRK